MVFVKITRYNGDKEGYEWGALSNEQSQAKTGKFPKGVKQFRKNEKKNVPHAKREARRISGGDGGESNSPSRRRHSRCTTGLVDSLVSLGRPLSTEFNQASQGFLGAAYWRQRHSTSTLCRPSPPRRGGGKVDV